MRLGAELMYDIFRFRGGYIISGTPFNDGIAANGADFAKNTITAGVGIKENHILSTSHFHMQQQQNTIYNIFMIMVPA